MALLVSLLQISQGRQDDTAEGGDFEYGGAQCCVVKFLSSDRNMF